MTEAMSGQSDGGTPERAKSLLAQELAFVFKFWLSRPDEKTLNPR